MSPLVRFSEHKPCSFGAHGAILNQGLSCELRQISSLIHPFLYACGTCSWLVAAAQTHTMSYLFYASQESQKVPPSLDTLPQRRTVTMAPRVKGKGPTGSSQKTNPRKLKQKREREELESLQAAVDAFDLTDVQDFSELPLSKPTQQGLK